MRELELKLLVSEPEADLVWERAIASGFAVARPKPRILVSTYFDTPDYRLRNAGLALRLRRDGSRWLQTVKTDASLHGGLSNVKELECSLDGNRIDIGVIADVKIRKMITKMTRDTPLEQVCETSVERCEGEVRTEGGTLALLAVDRCRVSAAGKSGDFCEIEIELQDGPANGLFDVARKVLPSGGVRFSRMAKSSRGFLLSKTGAIEPAPACRTANAIPISGKYSADKTARLILRECADQIAVNAETVLAIPDPEGVHQLRIGIRRLRTALSIFDRITKTQVGRRLAREAKWLGGQLGHLRDLDVIRMEMVLPVARSRPDEHGFSLLACELETEQQSVREELRGVMKSFRAQAFLFDLMEFVEVPGWGARGKCKQSRQGSVRISHLVDRELDKRWRNVQRRSRKLETMPPLQRHELRKELKKLRYAAEFFAPLYRKKKTTRFLAHLKDLQNVFGALNDASIVSDKFQNSRIGKSGAGSIRYAMGWICGSKETGAEFAWSAAREKWRKLNRVPVFWKAS